MNINETNQSLIFEKELKVAIYSKIGSKMREGCENPFRPKIGLLSPYRTIGFSIGLGSFVLTAFARVAVIIESLFKGIIHLLGCPFSKKCSLKEAGRQFKAFGKSVGMLPFSLLSSAFGILVKSGAVCDDPLRIGSFFVSDAKNACRGFKKENEIAEKERNEKKSLS